MKKAVFILILQCGIISVHAQVINSLTVNPSHPSTASNIQVLANMYFPSASCNDHTQFLSFTADTFFAYSLHCLGMLTTICNYTDTFNLGQLPAGNYNFIFHVDAGGGPSPCTPGIVAGPTDSISFTVSAQTNTLELNQTNFQAFYNPIAQNIQLKLTQVMDRQNIELVGIDGKTVCSSPVYKRDVTLSVEGIPTGFYFLRLHQRENVYIQKIVILR